MFELIQKFRSFYKDSALSDPPKTGKIDEYAGERIAWERYKQEREQYYKDLKKELDANLNPKSW